MSEGLFDLKCDLGFSLMELVTVCAIAGLLLSLGVPQFLRVVDRIALDTEIKGIQSTVLRAQALTFADQHDRRIELDGGSGAISYSMENDALPGTSVAVRGIEMMPRPKTTFRVRNDQISILFKPSGWITGGTLSLGNRVGDESRLVIQAVKGRVVVK